MICMIKMELVVFEHYLKQLSFTMLFVMTCVGIGSKSVMGIPSMALMMILFALTTCGAAYDEQNDWGAFRLVLPLSRRDVVLGRYVFNLIVALVFTAASCALVALLVLLKETGAPLGFLGEIIPAREGSIQEIALSLAVVGCIGLVLNSIMLPIYFKLGQTKATQWMPFIVMLAMFVPFFLLEQGDGELLGWLKGVFDSMAAGDSFTVAGIVAIAAALAVYAASAFVSIKLYEARDL